MTLKKFVILITISLLFAAPLFAEKSDQGIDWQRNVKKALEEAREKNAPIFIDFWATKEKERQSGVVNGGCVLFVA